MRARRGRDAAWAQAGQRRALRAGRPAERLPLPTEPLPPAPGRRVSIGPLASVDKPSGVDGAGRESQRLVPISSRHKTPLDAHSSPKNVADAAAGHFFSSPSRARTSRGSLVCVTLSAALYLTLEPAPCAVCPQPYPETQGLGPICVAVIALNSKL